MCPTRHYTRKNLGYLVAAEQGALNIIETDDDNLPFDSFWNFDRPETVNAHAVNGQDWVNVYHYYADAFIWPRGLPLEELHKELPALDSFAQEDVCCPIQQGLADENPDVDAVYRLTYPLPVNFKKGFKNAFSQSCYFTFFFW